MAKFTLTAAAVASLVFAAPAGAQVLPAHAGSSPVVAHTENGNQVIEIDMAALADPRPRALVSGPAKRVVPPPTSASTPRPKRFAHKAGQYEDSPLAALLTTN